ncbi:GNAT family N-acetyltransferase [Haloarculaceae archaeon H-GB2-1]|nr:GNAT family N-acetyltransferase [Haloarculaceae archaeon H-GB1-1]MEA5386700.1 GNAT family N-acetyltransferase [Haloarculaceae archaeon H-GB11]MEA5408228.1 GNAT family N-acetyltransferase [Haloarculaceae archaeon H-GB2-1]
MNESGRDEVIVERPSREAVETLTDFWTGLASEQRQYESHVLPEENRTAIREILVRQVVTNRILVARRGDTLVGFLSYNVESGFFEQDVTRGVVEHLYVLPDHRNDGIGSALLEAAEDALRDRNVDTLVLEAMADNEPARRFYRRHGYHPHRVELEKPVENDNH